MKSNYLLINFFSLAIWSTLAIAQADRFEVKSINVEEITRTMSKGEQPGFKIEIYDIGVEKAKELWKKTAKEQKAKLEPSGNELILKEGTVKSISPKPVNVYAIFLPHTRHVEWYTFFEIDSAFITKGANEVEYLAAKQFARDFAVSAYKTAVELEIKQEKDKLKELQKELDNLFKDKEKLNSTIASENVSINSSKENITTTEMQMELTRDKLMAKKQETAKQTSSELIKASEKTEKEIEKELDSYQKTRDKHYKDIEKSKSTIRETEAKIASTDGSIKIKQQELTSQKEVISKLQLKTDRIQ